MKTAKKTRISQYFFLREMSDRYVVMSSIGPNDYEITSIGKEEDDAKIIAVNKVLTLQNVALSYMLECLEESA